MDKWKEWWCHHKGQEGTIGHSLLWVTEIYVRWYSIIWKWLKISYNSKMKTLGQPLKKKLYKKRYIWYAKRGEKCNIIKCSLIVNQEKQKKWRIKQ